jgi:hypothetical protein
VPKAKAGEPAPPALGPTGNPPDLTSAAGASAGSAGVHPGSDPASLPYDRQCRLVRLNRLGLTGFGSVRDALIRRCGRPSCPACSAYAVRPWVRAARRTAGNWSFARCGITVLYPLLAYADIAADAFRSSQEDRAARRSAPNTAMSATGGVGGLDRSGGATARRRTDQPPRLGFVPRWHAATPLAPASGRPAR